MPEKVAAAIEAEGWLAAFTIALSKRDLAAAGLFRFEGFWRDLVAFTWNVKTLEGWEAIAPSPVLGRRGGREIGACGREQAWRRSAATTAARILRAPSRPGGESRGPQHGPVSKPAYGAAPLS